MSYKNFTPTYWATRFGYCALHYAAIYAVLIIKRKMTFWFKKWNWHGGSVTMWVTCVNGWPLSHIFWLVFHFSLFIISFQPFLKRSFIIMLIVFFSLSCWNLTQWPSIDFRHILYIDSCNWICHRVITFTIINLGHCGKTWVLNLS